MKVNKIKCFYLNELDFSSIQLREKSKPNNIGVEAMRK